MKDKSLRRIVLLLLIIAALAAAVLHLANLWRILLLLLGVLAPVFMGCLIAFILNKPFSGIQRLVVRWGKSEKSRKALRAVSLLLTYLLFFAVAALIASIMLPQLGESVAYLMKNVNVYAENLQAFIYEVADFFHLNTQDLTWLNIGTWMNDAIKNADSILSGTIPQLVSVTSNIFWGALNMLIGFIISFYILYDKKHLKAQCTRLLYSYVPYEKADRLLSLGRISSGSFSSFITGQVFSSFVLGVLCFAGMSIINLTLYHMDYIMLISVVIGITNCIPLVGPWMGAVPALLILLMVDPMEALWFGVFILLLQGISQNLIAPRIVGNKTGLPGLWVLVSITVGGGLFGIVGMVLSIPLASVLYRVLRADTAVRTQALHYSNKVGPAPVNDKDAEAVVRRVQKTNCEEK